MDSKTKQYIGGSCFTLFFGKNKEIATLFLMSDELTRKVKVEDETTEVVVKQRSVDSR